MAGRRARPIQISHLDALVSNSGALQSRWQHEDGRREEVQLQAVAWGSDLDALIALARHGNGIVLAPDFCVEPPAGVIEAGKATGIDAFPVGTAARPLVDILPGWRLQAGLEAVQALTLAMPAGSETARALVRFVREALSPR